MIPVMNSGKGDARDERYGGATIRSDRRGPRQYRRAWPCERDRARPVARDGVLSDGTGPDAGSLPDGVSGKHVGQRGPGTVSSADPRATGAAWHNGFGVAGSGGSAEAFALRTEI